MRVIYLPEAAGELQGVRSQSPKEALALVTAADKLQALGGNLRFPHCSHVQGTASTLWELRPRGGNSPWRAFYRRIGDAMVIGAIGPEATVDQRGFRRAIEHAVVRLDAYESEEE